MRTDSPISADGTAGEHICNLPAGSTAPSLLAEPLQPADNLPMQRQPARIQFKTEQHLLQTLATIGCFLFGIAMIANTHVGGEGGWFWYAVLYRRGKHLYSDLHLAQQPLMILETAWWMALLGKGWLVSKIPAIFHLIGYCAGLALLARQIKWSDLAKAIVILSAFFVSIHFEAYRFDDYHVMVHVSVLFSLYLLLQMERAKSFRAALLMASCLGVMSGLAITTRLNDGAAMFACVVLAIICIAQQKRAALVAAFVGCASIVAVCIVLLTGDSLQSYARNAIFHSAGPKGGVHHVLLSPFLLFWNTFVYLSGREPLIILALLAVLVVSWAFLVRPFSTSNLPVSSIKAVIGIAVAGGALVLLSPTVITSAGGIIIVISAVFVVCAFILAVFVLARAMPRLFTARDEARAGRKEVLFLLPFAMLLSGSMSSGGHHFGLYAPIGWLILTLPIVFTAWFTTDWVKSSFLSVACLMAISGAYFRVVDPYSWLGFYSPPMFSQRQIVRHPVYGPMVSDPELSGMFGQICSIIDRGHQPELLSIPFPYPNYYCNIEPWQGFVQTFFDTSGKDVIDDMISKLAQSPPKWVLYQRQLDTLALHEAVFNEGRRLPHRDLDEFIARKIIHGDWHIAFRGRYGMGNDWLLLQTY